MTTIKFGTSGWRDIIAEGFTTDNVRVVSQAIADYINGRNDAAKGMVIGYDTRFQSEYFARKAAQVFAANGIKCFFSDRDVPTPAVSFEILRRKAAGGINITASHNPPEYSGIKFSPDWGGPALPETTKEIEDRANVLMKEQKVSEIPFEEAKYKGLLEEVSISKAYLDQLRKIIDFSI